MTVRFLEQYKTHGKISFLHLAISSSTLTVACTPDDSRYLPLHVYNHSSALFQRYKRFKRLDDLEAATSGFRRAIDILPDGHPLTSMFLSNLGATLRGRFNRLGELKDLEDSITIHRMAVTRATDSVPFKHILFNGLGSSLSSRFERLGDLTDLENSVAAHRLAVELAPDDSSEKTLLVSNFANVLQRRYERLGNISDLEDAILHLRRAAESTPDHHIHNPTRLKNLGRSLNCRFERYGELADIENSITLLRRAIKLSPPGHPNEADYLHSLSTSLYSRFKRLDDDADIEDAISTARRALSLMSNGDPETAEPLNNLGNFLEVRFERRGNIADIEDAVLSRMRAIDLTPDDHPAKPRYLNNLGNSLRVRFDRLNEVVDIEDAVSALRRAVDLTPEGHAAKALYLNILGNILVRRFERLGDVADLGEAIPVHQQAVDLTPDDHPDKSGYLNSLAVSLLHRFRAVGARTDIDDAISTARRAVDLGSQETISFPRYYSNLGTCLHNRFKFLGDSKDLEEAITIDQRSVDLSPSGSYLRPGLINGLGVDWMDRLKLSRSQYDFNVTYNLFAEVLHDALATPEQRFHAARNTADICTEFPELVGSEAMLLQAYKVILQVIPSFIWLGQSVSHRYSQLSYHAIGRTVTAAAAVALSAKQDTLALEWLEEGRNVIWAQLDRLRSPVDLLRNSHPELAARLEHLATSLNHAGVRTGTTNSAELDASGFGSMQTHSRVLRIRTSVEDEARHNRDLAREYEDLLAHIRRLSGFEMFLKPKTLQELVSACQDGPVAMINVHQSRCDALVLCSSGHLVHVLLPDFSLDLAKTMRSSMAASVSGRGARHRDNHDRALRMHQTSPDDTIRRILQLLWLRIVQPILNAIKDEVSLALCRNRGMPHITWCPTEALSFLPLHAAGIYDPVDPLRTVRVSDFVISSYTPSLSTLASLHSHRALPACASPQSEISNPRVLVVSQSDTPGLNAPLPCTAEEASKILHHFPNDATHLEDAHATVDSVLAEMAQHDWVHLACHGVQDSSGDPTKSAFFLYNGRLELSRLMETTIPRAGLAVLSACQTATGDVKLPEEAAHLAAGMLAVGYRSVVGTMWSINDEDGPVLADALYGALRKQRERGEGGKPRVAEALHEALRQLREAVGEDSFARWVPFVHFGL
ncbi:CHAT domain-containing protein [Vararia minispora EC-137]|uniref:CHAT domain-containing protein n=1 Tax=Vararia minispora EC-137 TaxID=1314806 RepID=A0ACB8QP07_9AGAM|nr:CHAT domain-containing protein [Vararia minispora EC-137]